MSASEQQIATDLKGLVRAALPVEGADGGSADTGWLTALRLRAVDEAEGMERPGRKAEAWRYTSLGFLDRHSYVATPEAPVGALQDSDIEDLLLEGHAGPRLVFVNGRYAAGLSSPGNSAAGVAVVPLSAAVDANEPVLQRYLDGVAAHRHVFAAMNSALMSDGAFVHVGDGAHADHAIEILHVSVGSEDPAICHPRHLIVVGEGARAHVIERYCSLGDSVYFNNALVEVVVEPGAELVHESLQEESRSAQHLNDLHVRLGANSRYRYVHAGLGGDWARTDLLLKFAGEGAEADLNGLMLARDGQLNDVHLDVRHDVPGCTSREVFKSILDGRGRVVFDGKIVVARDAQKTDAALSNHNLMLSRSAEVDTKPQLEIFADDVKCSHGTTVGELDADALFYLRSRGIPADRATRLLCQAFAQDVIDGFDTGSLRTRAARLLDRRLAATTDHEKE